MGTRKQVLGQSFRSEAKSLLLSEKEVIHVSTAKKGLSLQTTEDGLINETALDKLCIY